MAINTKWSGVGAGGIDTELDRWIGRAGGHSESGGEMRECVASVEFGVDSLRRDRDKATGGCHGLSYATLVVSAFSSRSRSGYDHDDAKFSFS